MNINYIKVLLLILMILGHLLADYPLQGWLAQAKGKAYWENAPKKNKHDYIPALICHSLMWGIVTFIPLLSAPFFTSTKHEWVTYLLLVIAVPTHCFVDNAKANEKALNLWQDQLIHFVQIICSWLIFITICL